MNYVFTLEELGFLGYKMTFTFVRKIALKHILFFLHKESLTELLVETAQSSLRAIFKLVISGLTNSISVVWGTVNL